jgi:hypothetical protein
MLNVCNLFVSPSHGIRNDRFFDFKPNYMNRS